MIAERVDPAADAGRICEFAAKWKIAPELAHRIFLLAKLLPQPLQMVSGFRTPENQRSLPDGAPVDVSTHTSCPATGADLQVIGWMKTNAPPEVKRVFGGAALAAGLRWGGGSKVTDGIPSDWNHVDLGARQR